MSEKDTRSIYTAVRIPSKLREDAKKRAAQQGRTLSNYIKNLIREDLGEEGNAGRTSDDNGDNGYKTRKKK